MLTGLTSKTGVLDTTPLGNYMKSFFGAHNNTVYKKVVLSAVDIENGNYLTFDESYPDLVKAALSSSAIPFVFPNQHLSNGSIMMDGGTVWNLNLVSAIKRCRELVDDDSKIVIDII